METDVFLHEGIPKRITLLMRRGRAGRRRKKKKKKAVPRGKTVQLDFHLMISWKPNALLGTIEKDIPLWKIAFPNVSQAADSRCIFSESSLRALMPLDWKRTLAVISGHLNMTS